MPLYDVQITLQGASARPEDVVVNTLHVERALAASFGDIDAAIVALFNAGPTGGGSPLHTYFSSLMAQNGHTIKYYEHGDPIPRLPAHEHTFNFLAQPNGTPLPGQIALVCSFRAAYESGASRARRRNRVYLGRFDQEANSAGVPDPALINVVKGAFDDFLGASQADDDWTWMAYSKADDIEGGSDETGYRPVVSGYVDNRWDTQRRRAIAATTRTVFS